MTLEQLTQNIHQWGVDRKIIGNGTLQGQWYKLMSEYGELCDSLAKGKSPIDDIGDIYVVLVMMAGIDRRELNVLHNHYLPHVGGVYQAMHALASALRKVGRDDYISPTRLRFAVSCLQLVARLHELSLTACVEHAWNDIKDRRGYLNEHGVFVKEEPINGCHPSHVTRGSDSHMYDEICINCGAHDETPGGWGMLAYPCPKEVQ